jgi:hypothetical protein
MTRPHFTALPEPDFSHRLYPKTVEQITLSCRRAESRAAGLFAAMLAF